MKRVGIGLTLVARLVLVAGLVVLVPGSPLAQTPARTPVSLEQSRDGRYRIEGRFWTSANLLEVWNVLTDYPRIPQFASSVTVSRWHEPRGSRPLLEQQALVRVLFFSRRMTVQLEVEEEAGRAIRFTDISGEDFAVYRGSWTLEPERDRILVTYRLEARPRGRIPSFVARAAMQGSAQRLLEEVRGEIARRAEGSRAGGGGGLGGGQPPSATPAPVGSLDLEEAGPR